MRAVRRTAVGVAGGLATIALHAAFFALAVWGDGAGIPARRLDAAGAGANTGRNDGESHERRIYVQLTTPREDAPIAASQVSQLSATLQEVAMLQVTGPDALPMQPLKFEEQGESRQSTDAEMLARTRLAGVYESQIRARIERAWSPPENNPSSQFTCRVEIIQRLDGRIAEVELDIARCEGSAQWQQSLVSAIFTASPLPAPPDPSVFVDRFSLVFRASALSALEAADGRATANTP